LQVNAGIRAGREQEIQVELEVAVLPRGEEVTPRAIARIVDEHAAALDGRERFVVTRIARDAAGELPVGRGGLERRERIESDGLGRQNGLRMERGEQDQAGARRRQETEG